MPRPFLTARWSDLLLVNYRVPAELLAPLTPPGSELDTPDGEPDLYLLSLVAMRFSDTRVRGIPIPTAGQFPEVNLRFYVRRGPLRAAVFLREFVPVPIIVLGARLFYNQPYHLARISHEVRVAGETIRLHTRFARREHTGEIKVLARNTPETPAPDSREHFLKEHYWGFDRAHSGETFRYRVDHPVWRTYPVEQVEVTIVPGQLLGGNWKALEWNERLHSVVFAEGSGVVVYSKEALTVGEALAEGAAPTAPGPIHVSDGGIGGG